MTAVDTSREAVEARAAYLETDPRFTNAAALLRALLAERDEARAVLTITPADAATREAAAAMAMRDAAAAAVTAKEKIYTADPWDSGYNVAVYAAEEAIRALPLPDTGALDALLAQAREEGRKEEREALRTITAEMERAGIVALGGMFTGNDAYTAMIDEAVWAREPGG